MNVNLNRDTTLCISLSARPSHFGTRFHNFLFQHYNLNFIYKAFSTTDLKAALGGIRALGIRGSAISMPFKEQCIPLLDEVEPFAAQIGAVNTIVNQEGRLKGYNTDYLAVRELLKAGSVPASSTFLLYGSGGMAKAVLSALKGLNFQSGTLVSRNERTGRSLAEMFSLKWAAQVDNSAELLINASPVGMLGGPESENSPFSREMVLRANLIFDVVAMPPRTPLIQLAEHEGKQTICGADVIELQAAEQFFLYTGIRPDKGLVRKAAAFASEVRS
jgi:shikimate dehydrogenase